jgi:hypothetical protein
MLFLCRLSELAADVLLQPGPCCQALWYGHHQVQASAEEFGGPVLATAVSLPGTNFVHLQHIHQACAGSGYCVLCLHAWHPELLGVDSPARLPMHGLGCLQGTDLLGMSSQNSTGGTRRYQYPDF